ncbi:MAG: hydroxysqualene dehydroxylase HpnE [Gammaproteobacteria bacterium]
MRGARIDANSATTGNFYVKLPMPDNPDPIVIVGGGWAGLSCAVELVDLGHSVTLLESARQLGGRARRIAFDTHAVDNGQHILLGAYHHSLQLLNRLGIDLDSALFRQGLELSLLQGDKTALQLRLPHLINPLNLLVGLLKLNGLNLKDRWRALNFGFKLFSNSMVSEEDISVADLLTAHKQSAHTIRLLWEPICLAALNTPIEEASAQIFIRVLHDSFCRAYHDADLIIPRLDLGSLLPDRASDHIEGHGGFVHLSQRVTDITIERRHVVGISTQDRKYEAAHVVLAIPPHACQTLLKPHAAMHDIAYNMSGFGYHPICTIYLQYPTSVQTDRPLQGLLGTTTQWLVDRRISGQPGVIAAIISGPGKHMQLDNEQLSAHVQNELQQLFPHWPPAQSVMVIREKRATFSAHVGINRLRPSNHTPIHGLWLAGDYTNTGYPATIESAVISGLQTAKLIHHEVVKT